MGWEADRVLEGIFQWGEPLNIWEMELYNDRWGDMGYYVIYMNLDDDNFLVERLMGKTRGENMYFPRLIIMEGPKTRSVPATDWREFIVYKPWIYALTTKFTATHYPYDEWPGWTLGIGVHKTKANVAAVQNLFSSYKTKGNASDKYKVKQAA